MVVKWANFFEIDRPYFQNNNWNAQYRFALIFNRPRKRSERRVFDLENVPRIVEDCARHNGHNKHCNAEQEPNYHIMMAHIEHMLYQMQITGVAKCAITQLRS